MPRLDEAGTEGEIMRHADLDYLSVIGKNLITPIVKLIETLKLSGVRSVNPVQTSPFENGYAAAIILLTVCLLESMLNRTKHIMDERSRYVLEFFLKAFPDSGLDDKLIELFVIRNIIAHSYIWEAKIRDDKNYNLNLVSASLCEDYGNSNFRNAIDYKERKSKLLRMNLFSTRICWSDVVIVLKAALEILLFLEAKDRRYVYISGEYVEFNNKTIKFLDLVNDLK